MTKEQALQEWYSAMRMREQLDEKINNLQKIIFQQQLVPQKLMPKHDLMPGNRRSNRPLGGLGGETSKKIFKCLQEHGGELTSKEIATLCEITIDNVSITARRLTKLGFVNKRIEGAGNVRHAYYSVAIHRDNSDQR